MSITNPLEPFPGDLSIADPASLIPLREASKFLHGRHGKPPHPAVIHRWASPRRGAPAGDCRVVLPTVKRGGMLFTTEAACRWFEAARVRLGCTVKYGVGV